MLATDVLQYNIYETTWLWALWWKILSHFSVDGRQKTVWLVHFDIWPLVRWFRCCAVAPSEGVSLLPRCCATCWTELASLAWPLWLQTARGISLALYWLIRNSTVVLMWLGEYRPIKDLLRGQPLLTCNWSGWLGLSSSSVLRLFHIESEDETVQTVGTVLHCSTHTSWTKLS